MKPDNHVTNLGCFNKVAAVIGNANAQRELFKVVCNNDTAIMNIDHYDLCEAISWVETPQGYEFWLDISAGINPYEK